MSEKFTPLSGIKEGIDLNSINLPNLVELFQNKFGKKINVVNIAIAIETDEKLEDNIVEDIISFSHRSSDDRNNSKILIDMKNEKSYDKVIEILEGLD